MGIFDPKHHLAFMVLRRLRGPLNLMFRWREREAREGKPTPCPNLGGTCVTGGVGWGGGVTAEWQRLRTSHGA